MMSMTVLKCLLTKLRNYLNETRLLPKMINVNKITTVSNGGDRAYVYWLF